MSYKPSDFLARDIYAVREDRELTEEELESHAIMQAAVAAVEEEDRRAEELFILSMAAATGDPNLTPKPTPEKKIARDDAHRGGIVQTKQDRIKAWAELLPAIERQGIEGALAMLQEWPEEEREKVAELLQKVVQTRARTVQKYRFDRRKRTLVGARVNRDFADLCKAAARAKGLSVTKWCHQALQAALIQQLSPKVQEWEEGQENPWYGF